MSKINELLCELKELDKLKQNIIHRLWENSSLAKDLEGTELSKENIKKRVEVLADQIIRDNEDEPPVLVALMDGAAPFAALLSKALEKKGFKFDYSTMVASSYGDAMHSGELKTGNLPKIKLYARKVIIVDDVLDTGKTASNIRDLFLSQHADSVKIAVLVNKIQERPDGWNPDYAGFILSAKDFLIGTGMDYLGGLRGTSCIKTANLSFLPNEKEQQSLDRIKTINDQIDYIDKNQIVVNNNSGKSVDKFFKMPVSPSTHRKGSELPINQL